MNKSINYYPKTYRIPAAWEPCDVLVLVWPDTASMEEIQEFYEALSSLLPDYSDLLILVAEGQAQNIQQQLQSLDAPIEHIYFHETNSLDIAIGKWGPLIAESVEGFQLLVQEHSQLSLFSLVKELFPSAETKPVGFRLERSMLETDGKRLCLFDKQYWLKKNSGIEFDNFLRFLKESCSISDLLDVSAPVNLSFLPARLCPGNRILATNCDDVNSHYYNDFYHFIRQLREQVNAFSTEYEIIELPWIGDIVDDEGRCCFADYSQFFILNGAILLPMFNLPTDEDAMEIMSQVFPGFDILGFPSSVLVTLDTSLMKICLSIPEGILESAYE